jgi:hypothetical protein
VASIPRTGRCLGTEGRGSGRRAHDIRAGMVTELGEYRWSRKVKGGQSLPLWAGERGSGAAGERGSVTTAWAVLPVNRPRAGSRFTDHSQGRHVSLDLDDVRAYGHQVADLGESPVVVDTNAISVERNAWLSLPIGDGGGQQLSCRCWRCDTAHWTQPRRKTDTVAS